VTDRAERGVLPSDLGATKGRFYKNHLLVPTYGMTLHPRPIRFDSKVECRL
jgi:hypothetical protein